MKRLGVFSSGWDVSPSAGYLGGERDCESKVSCPRTHTHHNQRKKCHKFKCHTFVCNFFPREPRLPGQIYKQMYGKLEKLAERLLAKPHPSNLVNTIFYLVIHKLGKIQVWKKLFAIGFPYKHCNFWPLCLPTEMASTTVIRSIVLKVQYMDDMFTQIQSFHDNYFPQTPSDAHIFYWKSGKQTKISFFLATHFTLLSRLCHAGCLPHGTRRVSGKPE